MIKETEKNTRSEILNKNPWLDTAVIDREGFPDFNKLNPDTILMAQAYLLQERQQVVDSIRAQANPTFENTILALDNAMHHSQMMGAVFSWHLSNQTSEEWKSIAPKFQEQGINASSKIFTDTALFEKMKSVYGKKAELDESEQRLTEDYYNGFIDSGFNLAADSQKKFKELKTELSNLNRKFSDNITDDRKRFEWHLERVADLRGAPKWVLDSLENSAKEKELSGYLLTLEPNIVGELMQRVEVEATRKALYLASTSIATKGDELDNGALIVRIVQIRKQLSEMLGYPHFAAWTLRDRMVGTMDRLSHFYDEMVEAYLPRAKEEEAELVQFVRIKSNRPGLQRIDRWNRAYYIRLLEEEKTGFDQEILDEYFTLERSVEVVFDVIYRLYDVKFEEAHDLERPHPDTRAFRVKRADGFLLSYLLFDPYSRVGEKRGGAWMSTWKTPTVDQNNLQISAGVLGVTLNEAKRGDGKGTPIKLNGVRTLFHEFGHAIHFILSEARHKGQFGTDVSWDFVELPSQFMENFAQVPEVLERLAIHKVTGKTLPKEDLAKLKELEHFRAASFGLRQVALGLTDLVWHGETPENLAIETLRTIEASALQRIQIVEDEPLLDFMSATFSHIFSGGYAAGYYSYKWSEVLDADAFSYFLKEGIFNPETAKRFQKEVLAVGGSRDPLKAYLKFTQGTKPTSAALLRREGLK